MNLCENVLNQKYDKSVFDRSLDAMEKSATTRFCWLKVSEDGGIASIGLLEKILEFVKGSLSFISDSFVDHSRNSLIELRFIRLLETHCRTPEIKNKIAKIQTAAMYLVGRQKQTHKELSGIIDKLKAGKFNDIQDFTAQYLKNHLWDLPKVFSSVNIKHLSLSDLSDEIIDSNQTPQTTSAKPPQQPEESIPTQAIQQHPAQATDVSSPVNQPPTDERDFFQETQSSLEHDASPSEQPDHQDSTNLASVVENPFEKEPLEKTESPPFVESEKSHTPEVENSAKKEQANASSQNELPILPSEKTESLTSDKSDKLQTPENLTENEQPIVSSLHELSPSLTDNPSKQTSSSIISTNSKAGRSNWIRVAFLGFPLILAGIGGIYQKLQAGSQVVPKTPPLDELTDQIPYTSSLPPPENPVSYADKFESAGKKGGRETFLKKAIAEKSLDAIDLATNDSYFAKSLVEECIPYFELRNAQSDSFQYVSDVILALANSESRIAIDVLGNLNIKNNHIIYFEKILKPLLEKANDPLKIIETCVSPNKYEWSGGNGTQPTIYYLRSDIFNVLLERNAVWAGEFAKLFFDRKKRRIQDYDRFYLFLDAQGIKREVNKSYKEFLGKIQSLDLNLAYNLNEYFLVNGDVDSIKLASELKPALKEAVEALKTDEPPKLTVPFLEDFDELSYDPKYQKDVRRSHTMIMIGTFHVGIFQML